MPYLQLRYSGEIRNWHTYQLPLAATSEEEREQAAFYAQLLDETRRPRKRLLAGKPPDEFVSKNKNNHFQDCKVYGLALFFFLSKSRAATEKKAKRKTIKIKK
ncbi:MAG: hypothetical protein O7C75_21725 [Verrucomicrobia bacterium]|nr:hypothetical protein [Verrucomicrobiota bacterium]